MQCNYLLSRDFMFNNVKVCIGKGIFLVCRKVHRLRDEITEERFQAVYMFALQTPPQT